VWIYTGKKSAIFHGNKLSLSENIAKSFRGGATFFDSHCIYDYTPLNVNGRCAKLPSV